MVFLKIKLHHQNLYIKRIKEENGRIGKARAINSDLTFFTEQFIMPVKGIISGVYGSQRILNGKPKWPHYGIDIAAKQGTEIKSSGTGIVTMAEDDLYYTGGTVIMDHGHGISTIYSHLENVMVKVGDEVKQGEIIGTVAFSNAFIFQKAEVFFIGRTSLEPNIKAAINERLSIAGIKGIYSDALGKENCIGILDFLEETLKFHHG